MVRPKLLSMLLAAGVFLGALTVLGGEAATPPERAWATAPPFRYDSLQLRVQEAALELFRKGCLEARVVILPEADGGLSVFAACVEWAELRPASQ